MSRKVVHAIKASMDIHEASQSMDFCLSESDDGNPLNSMDAFDACSYNGNMRSTWNGPETLQAVLPLLLTSDVIIDIPSVQHEGGRGHFCISAPGKAEFRFEGREASCREGIALDTRYTRSFTGMDRSIWSRHIGGSGVAEFTRRSHCGQIGHADRKGTSEIRRRRHRRIT